VWGLSSTDAQFADFVRVHGPSLVHTAALLTGNHHSGEDLAQTVLTKVYLRWSRIDAPLAYAQKALVSTHIDGWRRFWRAETPTDSMPESSRHGGGAADSADGTADIGAVDSRDELRRALSSLSRRDRAVVVLRYYADLSEAQTAQLLDLPIGTVKSAASRALAQLRVQARVATIRSLGNHPLGNDPLGNEAISTAQEAS
jgi:RNA polymerase sigma-70 factor (sigma-E family)